jgi:nitroreductase
MEHKLIPTNRPVINLIRERWSPRSFSEKTISQEDMNTLLEAGSLAFSANNQQPWYYVYAYKGTDGFDALWSTLAAGNQPWAKSAAVLMISFARKVNDKGAPNPWSHHDLGAANATMVLQALSMGIYAHLMAGFSKQAALEVTGIDADVWEPVAAIALGYPGQADALDEPYLSWEKAPRTRKSIEEISRQL